MIAVVLAAGFAVIAYADAVPTCAATRTKDCWVAYDDVQQDIAGKPWRIKVSCFMFGAGKPPNCTILVVPVPQQAQRKR